MESDNGVEPEFVKGTLEKDSVGDGLGSNIENKVSDNCVDAIKANDGPPEKPVEEAIDSSGPDGGIPVKKAQKDQGGQNGQSNELQKKRPVLSHGLSVPSKGSSLGGGLRKSTTVIRQPKDASTITNDLIYFVSNQLYQNPPPSWLNLVLFTVILLLG